MKLAEEHGPVRLELRSPFRLFAGNAVQRAGERRYFAGAHRVLGITDLEEEIA